MGCDCPGKKRVQRIKEKTTAGTRRVILFITGMHCAHCELMVRSVLESVDGVRDLLVEKGKASFQAPRDLDLQSILSALRALDYDVSEVR